MNFLAHLYLSGNEPEIAVGNFIGDFVKGKNLALHYGKNIAKGISLHREIDWYTDHHETVKQSKHRLRNKYRHYSGVIVDVFYDHFLAKLWHEYSTESLAEYADWSYRTIQQHNSVLPDEVKMMLPYMMKGNWLVNYAHLEGIHRALSGMAHRTRFVSKMEEATEDLKVNYSEFENEFKEFFPQLIKFSNDWLATHA
ncbi:MAG: DUF479 domain-containing protein [Bacteroidetes bacterium]|nr:DUF479 domain-containing protein [Bacteroidota bacterium]